MKIPQTPPNIFDLVTNRNLSAEQLLQLLQRCAATDAKGRYLHWDKLRYLKPPAGLTVATRSKNTKPPIALATKPPALTC